MAAIMNGIALHGGFIPYGGTFLTFSDYSRNAIRMAALMKQRVIHVFTHDSIGLGEDGPTHQSIEHAASLRLIPNLDVWRPCDTRRDAGRLGRGDRERATARARCCCRARTCPTRPRRDARRDIAKGAYVLAEPSEVGLQQKAAGRASSPPAPRCSWRSTRSRSSPARERSIAVRVVSMPSTTVFDRQSAAYKSSVLPPGVPRIAVEMGVHRRLVEVRLRRGRRHRHATASRRRRRRCSSTSASRPRTSSPRCGAVLRNGV